MQRKVGIFAVLSIFLLSLCLLGCQHGDSGTTSATVNALALKEQGDSALRDWKIVNRSNNGNWAGRRKEWNDYAYQPIKYYTEALRISPQYAEAYYGRAEAQMMQFGYSQAMADYTAALRINPQYAEAYYKRGELERGYLAQPEQAIADYTAALRIKPQFVDAYYARGVVYGEKGQYEQAIADYTVVLRINPQHADAYCNRGEAYDKKGQYEQAIADYTAALRIKPQYSSVYYNKGLACKKIGRKTEAIEAYRQFLRYALTEYEAEEIKSAKQSLSELGG